MPIRVAEIHGLGALACGVKGAKKAFGGFLGVLGVFEGFEAWQTAGLNASKKLLMLDQSIDMVFWECFIFFRRETQLQIQVFTKPMYNSMIINPLFH